MSDKTDVEIGSSLTPKQRIFCHEYVVDWNATRAAKIAGYSEDTAFAIGAENLRKPKLKEYIDHIQKDLAKLAGVSALKVIQELQKIAFCSIAHLHNTWIERKDFEELTEDQKSAIESIDTKILKRNIGTATEPDIVDVECIKIKLFDKAKALEMINKMLGYDAVKKIDLTTQGESINGSFTPEERQERIASLIAKAGKTK